MERRDRGKDRHREAKGRECSDRERERAEAAERARADAELRASHSSDESRAEIDSLRAKLGSKEAEDICSNSDTERISRTPDTSSEAQLKSTDMRNLSLNEWLADNSTERIDLRIYAQAIHDADIDLNDQ